jgi:hypothetical protein
VTYLLEDSIMDKVELPEWLFLDNTGEVEYFMVCLEPGGRVSTDGSHDGPKGVVEAKALYEAIDVIRPKPGSRYFMVTIQPVPDVVIELNQDSVDTLNEVNVALNTAARRLQ